MDVIGKRVNDILLMDEMLGNGDKAKSLNEDHYE